MAVRTARAVLLLGTQGDAAQAIAGELARAGDTVIGADFDRLPLGLRLALRRREGFFQHHM